MRDASSRTHRLHDWLCERIHAARMRARAERARPWQVRLRRWLRDLLLGLAALYVLANLCLPSFIVVVATVMVDCHVVDAGSSLPLRGATLHRNDEIFGKRSDAAGRARLEVTTTPSLYWVFPAVGSFHLGGQVHVEADGYRPADVPLPEWFDWPLFGMPHAELTVRMQR